MQYYAQSITDTLRALATSQKGLSTKEIQQKRKKYGANKLPVSRIKVTKAKIFLSQFSNILMIILIAAGVISGLLGEIIDMTVIFITVAINAVVGFIQENKANNALEQLNHMIKFQALVLRDEKKVLVDSAEIVPGDILFVQAGDKIQADGRIIEQTEFHVNESALTGESEPVKKSVEKIAENSSLGDQKNMVHRGTVVESGRATVVVTAIGAETALGKIAKLVKQTADEQTPLQRAIASMSKMIGIIVAIISVTILFIGLFVSHYEFVEMFEIAVALAVAAIPEGLAISLTVILAIGMSFILKHRALVRKLVSAETLGSVSVICTDKTGTLTEGKMTIEKIVTASESADVDGIASILAKEKGHQSAVHETLLASFLANDGTVNHTNGKMFFSGDTTDTAILSAGHALGWSQELLSSEFPRIDEVPFSSSRMHMATLHREGKQYIVYGKGALEVIIDSCTKIFIDGKEKTLTKKIKEEMKEKEAAMAQTGLRVIAVFSKKHSSEKIGKEYLQGATLLGLIALTDPLRNDVPETLQRTTHAGIRTIMITGDHVKTAKYIGQQLGFSHGDKDVFDGTQLETITDLELKQVVARASIFARVDPIHKIRIVQALQANGEVVAMTGDGVNDAPAIKGADIGVALGSGTDVAKETADMVLLDDSFRTIVDAVEEGRTMYQNIRKVILYLLAGSFASVILVSVSLLFGLPLPVLPVQILWVNIVEDAFPTMALAFDPGDKENMREAPRKRDEYIINSEMLAMIIAKSILANVALVAIFYYTWVTTGDIALTRTVVFVGLGIDALFFIFAIRSLRHMVWQMSPINNRYLLGAIGLGWAMLLLAIYWSPLQVLLRTVPLGLSHWLLMISFGIFNLILIECVKIIFRLYKKSVVPAAVQS